MKIEKISKILTDEQISRVLDNINHQISIRPSTELGTTAPEIAVGADIKFYRSQGRMDLEEIHLDKDIQDVFDEIATRYDSEFELIPDGVMYARYDGSIGGNPFLGPHYDGGNCDFMLDYQLESNTSWAVGQNEIITDLEDNEAVTLYPLSKIHYRPKKIFSNNEFVTALFFRYTAPRKTVNIQRDTSENLEQIVNNLYENYYGENQ